MERLMKKIAVLIIEDLQMAQKMAVNIFTQLDCYITVVPNGAGALDLIINHQFDIVFLDIELPDINGFDITATVRSLESLNRHIPIVAVTANYFENFEIKCQSAGFNDFMMKPLTVDAVRHMLEKYLSKKVD
jgi:two-component system, OmpR family, aerobic respiration control sensor histidine kinase ArcB